MDLYYYNLNTKVNTKWPSSRIITFEKYKELSLSFNDLRFYNCSIIENGGWHLSYFGDSNFIKNKIVNFPHQEYIMFANIEHIEDKVNNFSDLYNRDSNCITKISIKDNNNLPFEYEKYLKKFIIFE
jgi:beta-1,4-mannosyl-glycoprotein beta-1,4-N-acetylglucosaminyltransferase